MEALKDQGYTILESNDKIIVTPKEYKQTFIWMHELTGSAKSSLDIFCRDIKLIPKNTKLIFMQSPTIPVTVMKQMVPESNAWFDVYEFNLLEKGKINFKHVEESSAKVLKIIHDEAKLLKNRYSRIFIGGFSQGCALSIYTAFKLPQTLGGVIGVSGFLLPEININEYKSRSDIKFIITQGKNDELLPLDISKKSYEKLNVKDFDFTYIEIDNCKHEVNEVAIKEIAKLIELREKDYPLYEKLEENGYSIREYKDRIEAIPSNHLQTLIWMHHLT